MNKKKIISLLLAVSLTSGAALVGCGSNENNSTEGNKNNSEAKVEGVDKDQYINVFMATEPKTLDPSRSSDMYSLQAQTQIFEGLTKVTQENGQDKIIPGAAESWDVEDEGKTYTFHLRDAKWADGKPVTAEDFVYGLKRTLDPNTGSPYSWIIKDVIKGGADFNAGKADASTVGITAIDEKTLKIELASPVAYFLDLSYFRVLFPQRQDIVEKYGEAYGSEAEQMMANGAFILKEWVHDNKFVFEKNPNYWNADSVKLDKLTMTIVKDEGARMNMILNGQVDTGYVSKPEWKEKFNNMDDFEYISRGLPSALYEVYNQKNKYFKNAKIRKAFLISLDRDELNNTLHRGANVPAKAWCPPKVQIGGEDFREKSGAGAEWIKILQEENPDPKALLIEGLKEEGLDPDPSKMEITMLKDNYSSAREDAEYRQQKLQEILGIKVTVDYYDWAIFSEKMQNSEYDFCSQSWSGDYNDPMTFFEVFAPYASIYPTGWKNDEYDELMKKSAQTNNNEERFEMFKRAEEILLYEDAVISPIVYFKSSVYRRKFVKGVKSPLFSSVDFSTVYTEGRD